MRALAIALIAFGSCRAQAAPLAASPPPEPAPASFAGLARFEIVARKLDNPVGMVFAPGDPKRRLFIVEKTGRVKIFAGGKVAETPFLDLSGQVSKQTEQGLLGLAFHPHFADNRRLFVNYTDLKGDTRVVEYKVSEKDAAAVDMATARELLFVKQPYANHNGGDLVFGPDGKLYIGLGDGGAGFDPHGNGQNRDVMLAKMLVMDVDAAQPKAAIAAIGLRNPWRYTFDRKTGDLYIADVGQERFEEVDYVPAGKLDGSNFGWSIMEGLHCLKGDKCEPKGLTLPVVEYDHNDGCSITGGFVYRGTALPELDGVYLFSDYCTALLRGFKIDAGKITEYRDYKAAFDPKKHLANVASFAEDQDGELYIVSLAGFVYELVRAAAP